MPREHLRALSIIGVYKIVRFIQLEVVSLFSPSEYLRVMRIIQLGLSQLFLQFEQGLLCDTLRDQCKC
jgi:hypothetical protein